MSAGFFTLPRLARRAFQTILYAVYTRDLQELCPSRGPQPRKVVLHGASYNRYDARLRLYAQDASYQSVLRALPIPRSTLATWKKTIHRAQHIVGLPSPSASCSDLDLERLEAENNRLREELALVKKANQILGLSPRNKRLSESQKRDLLALIRSAEYLKCEEARNATGLSRSRFYRMLAHERRCGLADYPSCPKSNPTQASSIELKLMRRLATSAEFAHLTISSLAKLAMREFQLFLSPTTWHKKIREFGWRRPAKRKYPAKRKTGIRTKKPNEIWHIDVTRITLADNSWAYFQAVIDNHSRFILSHRLSRSKTGLETKALIQQALHKAINLETIPNLWCDDGSENDNSSVNELIASGKINRTIAQVDVSQSNSMIEAFFKSMKHNYLFNQDPTSFGILAKQIEFYIQQHNEVIPHSALDGATPLEKYTGQWTEEQSQELKSKAAAAREARIRHHKNASCGLCPKSRPV